MGIANRSTSYENIFPPRSRKNYGTIILVMILLACPTISYGDGNQIETTIKWDKITDLKFEGGQDNKDQRPVAVGAFLGVHNGALIVAGGATNLNVVEHKSSEDLSKTIYSNSIWIATRGQWTDQNGDGEISADERSLSWKRSEASLPGNRAYGASAVHGLGLIAIGGTDGEIALNDAVLIRWDEDEQQVNTLRLPPMPGESVKGGAVVIGSTVYVVAGNDDYGYTGQVYSFDLSQIEIDSLGNPISHRGLVKIKLQEDVNGNQAVPWQRLPSLPLTNGEFSAGTEPLVVAQHNGSGKHLYVISQFSARGLEESVNKSDNNSSRLQKPLPVYTSVWEYDVRAPASEGIWIRNKNATINGLDLNISGGAITALGQSHILILSSSENSNKQKALSYNSITDAWTSYREKSPTRHVYKTKTLLWDDEIIAVEVDECEGCSSPGIWRVQLKGPKLSFGWENTTILIVYLLSVVLVGIYFVFKNKTTDDYFRGGKHIPWWAAACSIYATMMSSLSFIGLPALVYRTDWVLYLGVIGLLIATPAAVYIALPFFRQIDATSAYEYLSKRFNMPVRLIASGLFTLFHVGRIGIVLALTALALAAVTPLEPWQSVLLMGVLSIIYSTLGGIEAVIWTDTIQTVVLLIGALLCIGFVISGIDGGFSSFVDRGIADQKFRMVDWDFSSGSISSLSIWIIIVGGIGQNLSSYTADQAVVQRYMTTSNIRAAGKSIWMNAAITVPGMLLFFVIGTGLYGFYQSHPAKLDPTIQIDQILPAFISTELPLGIAGLIVAAIFAAAQSTISTSMNSMATTLVTDFMRPFGICKSEQRYLIVARILTVLSGVLGTFTGLMFINPEIRSLMEQYFVVIGMCMGVLGGLFVLGATTRRANGIGALFGIFSSSAIMVAVWIHDWANGYIFAAIGILSSLVFGYLASLLLQSDNKNLEGLTIYSMRRKLVTND